MTKIKSKEVKGKYGNISYHYCLILGGKRGITLYIINT